MTSMRFALLGVLFAILATSGASGLVIDSPTENTTYTGVVPIDVSSNVTVDSLTASVDGQEFSCLNCSELTGSANLSDGDYVLTATEMLGNETLEMNVSFAVLLNSSEENGTDNGTTNETDSGEDNHTVNASVEISVADSYPQGLDVVFVCEPTDFAPTSFDWVFGDNSSIDGLNVSDVFHTFPENGTYVVECIAHEENLSASDEFEITVASVVMNDTDQNETDNENETPVNETGEPRFTVGLNKLPQEVEAGTYTDAELAQIIRDNQLNPGVINRLVKTGMLGNESIDAIIETQFTPPGIFRKVIGFFGFHVPTPKERLVEQYELSDVQKARLMLSEDTSEQVVEELEQELPEETVVAVREQRTNPAGRVPPGLQRGTSADDEDSDARAVPPGQQRRADQAREDADRTPPGRADDSFEAGSQRGNSARGNADSGAPGNSGNAPGRNR